MAIDASLSSIGEDGTFTPSSAGVLDEEEFDEEAGHPTPLSNVQLQLIKRNTSERSLRSVSDMSDPITPAGTLQYFDISVDEYAPKLSDVKEWIGAVVNEVVPKAGGGKGGSLPQSPRLSPQRLQGGFQAAAAPNELASDAILAPSEEALIPQSQLQAGGDGEPEPTATGDGGTPPCRPQSVIRRSVDLWTTLIGDAGGSLEAGGAEKVDFSVHSILETLSISLQATGEHLGAFMAPAVKHDLGNVEKVRQRWAKLGKPTTIRAVLEAEIATGIHQPGKAGLTLRDASVAVAIVWLRRSLAFRTSLLEGFGKNRTAALSVIATDAYKKELEKHHNWMLKSTFKLAFNAAPSRSEVLHRLGVGLDLDEEFRHDIVYGDLADLVRVQRFIVCSIGKPLVDLDVDRSAADHNDW